MAFVTASPTTLCRDVWPEGKGRLMKDTSTLETLPRYRVVPDSHDELSDWLCVDPCGGDSGSTVFIHPDCAEVDGVQELTLRLEGFVEDISVGMMGTWNGKPEGAPKALQTLTLVSGRCHAAFDPQIQALANIREFVLKLLSRSDCNTFSDDGKIHLKRRVFERVRPTDDNEPSLPIPKAEDPAGRAKKIAHLWAVRHCIEAGVQRADGRVQRENARVIRPGDFVDVAVTVQAIPIRVSKTRRIIEVYFVPQTIIRLIPSEASVDLLQAIEQPEGATTAAEAPIPSHRDVGFSFDLDHEPMAQ